VGGFEATVSAEVEPSLKYHPSLVGTLTQARDPGRGQRLVGSLTGAVASQRVTEAPKGSLSLVGNQTLSARAQGSLTVRPTGRAGAKAGPSDPTTSVWKGRR
jgi:Family of unknown function (DUF6467)